MLPYFTHGSSVVNEFSLILMPPENISNVIITKNNSEQCKRCFDIEFIFFCSGRGCGGGCCCCRRRRCRLIRRRYIYNFNI